MRNGDYDGAQALQEEALTIFRRLRGEESREVGAVVANLGVLAEWRGDFETAESLYSNRLRYDNREDLTNLNTAVNIANLAWVLYAKAEFARAEDHFREALSLHEKLLDRKNPIFAYECAALAMTLVSLEEYEKAAELFEAALETAPDLLAVESQRSAQRTSAHGKLLTKMGRYEEAEGELLTCLDFMQRELPPNDPRTRRTLTFLVELYEAWGKSEKAGEYKEKLDEPQ